MRFLLVTQYYPPEVGAAPVRLQAMVRQLVERGHEVEIVTALPNYPTGRIFDEYRGRPFRTETRDGAIVHRVWVYAATGSGIRRMLALSSFAVMSTVGLLRTRRPDVVLVESPPLIATIPALLHRLVRRRPNVLLLADLWPDTAVELGLLERDSAMFRVLERLERYVYSTSWRISPVTLGQVTTLVEEKNVPPDRIVFLPNGVDTALFAPSGSSVHGAPRTILFAGTLGYAQGIDVILDAVPRVRERHSDVSFLFVGGGSEAERLRHRVAHEQIAGVEFRPPVPVDEIAPLLRECFAGITSLRSSKVLEGARPSKIFAIMASGRPVVYSGDGEGARLVVDTDSGVAAPAEDVRALVTAICDLLDDPDGADRMGRNGRAFVEEHLAWPVLIDAWLEGLSAGEAE